MSNSYIIHGGQKGADRLLVLAEATWENTKNKLITAGINSNMSILDVGCGNGIIAQKIIDFFGKDTNIVGIDFDEKKIDIANQNIAKNYKNVKFLVANVMNNDHYKNNKYDFIIVRFLLSHIKTPLEVLKRLKEKLNPNGVIYVEDVDFSGYFSFPDNYAFNKYIEYYKIIGSKAGGDPLIGPKLYSMFLNLNFSNVNVKTSNEVFKDGAGKLIAPLTFEGISGTIIEANLETKQNIDKLINDLYEFYENKDSLISLPRFFHVWGTN